MDYGNLAIGKWYTRVQSRELWIVPAVKLPEKNTGK
jgi:hypothetical protein